MYRNAKQTKRILIVYMLISVTILMIFKNRSTDVKKTTLIERTKFLQETTRIITNRYNGQTDQNDRGV